MVPTTNMAETWPSVRDISSNTLCAHLVSLLTSKRLPLATAVVRERNSPMISSSNCSETYLIHHHRVRRWLFILKRWLTAQSHSHDISGQKKTYMENPASRDATIILSYKPRYDNGWHHGDKNDRCALPAIRKLHIAPYFRFTAQYMWSPNHSGNKSGGLVNIFPSYLLHQELFTVCVQQNVAFALPFTTMTPNATTIGDLTNQVNGGMTKTALYKSTDKM